MPFPQIRHCLVCEDIRPEAHRKNTLLGFYGVTPYAEIRIQDLTQPIGRLAFFLMGGPGEGTFKVSFEILGEDGFVVVPRIDGTAVIKGNDARYTAGYNFTFGFGLLRFPAPGRYTVRLFVEGQPHFEDSFAVSQGAPGEFQS